MGAAHRSAEAAEIWAVFEREHRLEALPPEPPQGAPGVLSLVVVLPAGRRLSRRFDGESDTLQHVFDYAEGSAGDEDGWPHTRAVNFHCAPHDLQATLCH